MSEFNYEVKDIKGYEGLYRISNTGDVFRFDKNTNDWIKMNKWLNNNEENNAYYCVTLYKYDEFGYKHKKNKKIHILVAEAFLGEKPSEEYEVDHIDENKLNNCITNLRWLTHADNIRRCKDKKCSMIPIVQIDKNGNIINCYLCAADASRETGIWVKNIYACTNGKRKSAGGYIWKKYNEVFEEIFKEPSQNT